MAVFGPAVGILLNSLMYLPRLVWTLRMPYTGHIRDGERSADRIGFGLRDVPKAIREVSSNRTILAMVALAAASALLVGNAYYAQMPEFAQDLGADDAGFAYGALVSATAAGSISGGLLMEGTGLLPPKMRTAMAATGI